LRHQVRLFVIKVSSHPHESSSLVDVSIDRRRGWDWLTCSREYPGSNTGILAILPIRSRVILVIFLTWVSSDEILRLSLLEEAVTTDSGEQVKPGMEETDWCLELIFIRREDMCATQTLFLIAILWSLSGSPLSSPTPSSQW
jgi:hypothetical protein